MNANFIEVTSILDFMNLISLDWTVPGQQFPSEMVAQDSVDPKADKAPFANRMNKPQQNLITTNLLCSLGTSKYIQMYLL